MTEPTITAVEQVELVDLGAMHEEVNRNARAHRR